MSARADEIKKAISEHRVVVVCGETGSGKSTQLPKICLDLGRGVRGLIAHTQPRRLAARSVASRVAEELSVPLGAQVGTKVRFNDETSDATLVKVMTDGMLLAESRSDRRLLQYDTIIIDEAHERSLNIDFLLGILTRVLPTRPDLSLVITSATIDPARFADHFADALGLDVPIIEVSGRTFPVETVYAEPIAEDGRAMDTPDAVADAVERLAIKDGFGTPGDVLVFLPGEREIRESADAVRRACEQTRLLHGTEVVPLYARLSIAEQQRVFRRVPHRRVVLATNVAETSLTVPGIRYVVDTGLARINRYSPRRRVQSLQVEPVSQASARQRAGRCGRTEPGTCIRLYSEADHDKRPEFTAPEIQRTNLAGVILQMHALRLGDPREFPFVEPPEPRRISEAYDTLFELGAVDGSQKLTPLGSSMAKLPIDPRIARIILAARDEGALAEALIIAAAMEVQDPRERPSEQRDAADAKHQRFQDNASDFITLLNLWDHYHDLKARLSRSQLRKTCRDEFISMVRMHEWTDTHRQLREVCRDLGARVPKRRNEPDRDALHRAVLAGCLTSVGKRNDEGGFTSPSAGVFHIHPASAVRLKGSSWLVAAELVKTTRLFTRLTARIDPEWVEELAPHLITREYSNPGYEPDRGRVEADAAVRFGQIEITRGRRVDYGSVDRADARRIFIEQALVQGELETNAAFRRHNEAFLSDLRDSEAKLRRSIVPTDEDLFAFFDRRLPSDISSARAFDKWLRRAEREDPRILLMDAESVALDTVPRVDASRVPDTMDIGTDGTATLDYTFDPGSDRDGIAATLHATDAARTTPAAFDWLVPAWLPMKVEAIIAGLPRSLRKQVDAESVARQVIASIRFGEGDLFVRVAEEASRITGLSVTPAMCRAVPLPEHLRLVGIVVDADDREIIRTREMHALIEAARKHDAEIRRDATRAPIVHAWPAGESRIDPPLALADALTGARLLEFGDAETASIEHWFGSRRLVGHSLRREVRELLRHTPHADRAAVMLQSIESAPSLLDAVLPLLAEVNRPDRAEPPRTADQLASLADKTAASLGDRATRTVSLIADVLDARQNAVLKAEELRSPATQAARRDIEFQVRQLVHAGSFQRARWATLSRTPAYLRGVVIRIERLRGDGIKRDAAAQRAVARHWTRCIDRAARHARIGRTSPALERYRWLIEEFRLSAFATQLAIRGGGSERRLDDAWQDVERAG